MKRSTEQKIAAIEASLFRLRNTRRKEQKRLQSDRRREHAHKAIGLGGIVIAAGVDGLNPGEICGVLLAWKQQRAQHPEHAARMLESGLEHFAARTGK